MPGKPRPAAETGAIALTFPAGVAGYFFRGDWPGVAVLLPGLLSALLIAMIVSKTTKETRLTPPVSLALVAMHVVGGATIALLTSGAVADIATRPELLPALEWSRPISLVIFVLVDVLTLGVVKQFIAKR